MEGSAGIVGRMLAAGGLSPIARHAQRLAVGCLPAPPETDFARGGREPLGGVRIARDSASGMPETGFARGGPEPLGGVQKSSPPAKGDPRNRPLGPSNSKRFTVTGILNNW